MVCARRRHRQYSVRRAQPAQDGRTTVEATPPTPAAPPAPPAPLVPPGPQPGDLLVAAIANQSIPPAPLAPAEPDPTAVRVGGHIPITSTALVDSLMIGSITASNITNYSITMGTGGNGITTWSTGWNGNTATTTWASSAATTGQWMLLYDEGSAVQAGRVADQVAAYEIDPYAGLGSDPPTYRYEPYAGVPPLPPETAEQRERREQLRRERREQWDREQAERRERERVMAGQRAAADGAARALLLGLLTDAQRAEFETRGTITVVGSAGNLFRLETGHHEGNVTWLDGDPFNIVRGTMCAHPPRYHGDEHLPLLDVIAGQLLAIITDEPGFVRVANRYTGDLPTYPAPEPEPEPEPVEAEAPAEGGLVVVLTDEAEAA